MRVALIHDWLTGMRGGEYVLEAIAELFPTAELFTLICVPGKVSPSLANLRRHTSWLQKVPGADERYRQFLPLMPFMIESFDLTGFDLIVSSSHCVAKGVRKSPRAVHVSYVHAPMRYMWDRYSDYFAEGKASLSVRTAARLVRPWLQNWDRRVSQADRIDHLVANSKFIAQQIRKNYGRDASVVYPFADLSRFNLPRQRGDHYLMVGAFAPYKRVDLAIEAFNRLKLKLQIVGGGQDRELLKKIAGPTVEFLGHRSNSEISELYSKCKAFIFPGLEDFGITPLEAMASGAPVIAFGEGGASETVTSQCGVLFRPQTVDALEEALLSVESGNVLFDEQSCRRRAADFTREKFQRNLYEEIRAAWVRAGQSANQLDNEVKLRSS